MYKALGKDLEWERVMVSVAKKGPYETNSIGRTETNKTKVC